MTRKKNDPDDTEFQVFRIAKNPGWLSSQISEMFQDCVSSHSISSIGMEPYFQRCIFFTKSESRCFEGHVRVANPECFSLKILLAADVGSFSTIR